LSPTRDAETSDPELLQRFTNSRDEAAFAALVRRHGPMVREVCRRLLGQVSDVEDASQVVFPQCTAHVQGKKISCRRQRIIWKGDIYG
jgi:hypothetical protein